MHAYFLSHIFTVLGVLMSLAVMRKWSDPRRTSQSIVAWILGFVFLPFAAIPLFLLFGSRKFPTFAKGPSAARMAGTWLPDDVMTAPPEALVVRSSGVAPPRSGNSFELITDGQEAYRRLLRLIASAEHSIDVTMFILGDDETGRSVIDALVERASKGVRVRVILDAVGSRQVLRRARNQIGARGGEVRAFMPLYHSPIRGRTNLRSHRKLIVVDRRFIFGGGMNLADEYMGAGPYKGPAPRWRDIAAVIEGPAARDAEAVFESDWLYAGGAPRAPSDAPSVEAGDEIVQVVPSGPDITTDSVYDVFLTAIGRARERITIVTPYYVPDDDLQHALVLAARRGVRTEVVVPTVSNHSLPNVARRPLLRELIAAGVTVSYYAPGMVHAKAMIVDDSFAYVGSPNFDMRSFFLNYENATCLYSPGAIGQVRTFAEALIPESTPHGPDVREHALLEAIARILAPEL